MFPYEGQQNNLHNPYRQQAIPMDEDLPIKPEVQMQELRAEIAELRQELAKQKRASAPRPAVRRKRTVVKSAQIARPVKKLPPMKTPGEQPRDNLGRFASKTGAVLWGATKATGRAIKSTAKAVGKAHKTVKRVQSAGRRRARLEERERKIALAEREKKLGLRKKVVRRKKR